MVQNSLLMLPAGARDEISLERISLVIAHLPENEQEN
jgi:hypothetical protein